MITILIGYKSKNVNNHNLTTKIIIATDYKNLKKLLELIYCLNKTNNQIRNRQIIGKKLYSCTLLVMHNRDYSYNFHITNHTNINYNTIK